MRETARHHGDREPPGGWDEAVLEVRDDGPSIPPDVLPDVFERSARPDSSRARGSTAGPGDVQAAHAG